MDKKAYQHALNESTYQHALNLSTSRPEAAPEVEAPEFNAEAEAEATPTAETEQAEEENDLIDTIESERLKEALHKRRMDGRGRPRKGNTDARGKRTDGYSRTSLIVNDELWAKVKEVSFKETLTMKEIIDLALHIVVERYEAKHGTIKPKQRHAKDINEIF